jgi:hypothetical protein
MERTDPESTPLAVVPLVLWLPTTPSERAQLLIVEPYGFIPAWTQTVSDFSPPDISLMVMS